MLVSQGCHSKWPKTRWLETEIYFLRLCRLDIWNQGVIRPMLPLKSIWVFSLLLPASGNPGSFLAIDASLQFLSLPSHDVFLVCMWAIFPLLNTSHAKLAPPFQNDLINSITPAKTLFPNKLKFTGASFQILTYLFSRDMIQFITDSNLGENCLKETSSVVFGDKYSGWDTKCNRWNKVAQGWIKGHFKII